MVRQRRVDLRIALPSQLSDRDAHGRDGEGLVIHLPSPLAFLRHALPALLEGVIAPFALFYLVLVVAGFRGALLAGLGWSLLALSRRLLRHERPPATLVMGTVLLTIRTAISFVTGSSFLYFVQPSAATGAIALLFLVSAVIRRPLTERLARDFCPLDPVVLARPSVRRFFVQISLLWAVVLLANAGFVIWLLLTASLHAFVLERTAVSWTLTGSAIAVSTLWFMRSMRRAGIAVHWGGPAPAPVAMPGR